MKPVDVTSSRYIDFDKTKEGPKEGPKFKVGYHVRISKHKNIFVKDYVPNNSEKALVVKKLIILFRRHMLLVTLMVKKLFKHFTKKNCKKQIKNNLELKK